MRSDELKKLKWSYIDRENGLIRLPAEVCKEKQAKNIPINYHVKKVLLSVPKFQDHDFVFTFKGKPLSRLQYSFQVSCKNANIPFGRKDPNGATFHDIRRTVKTNMLSAGIDKAHRDVILGHSLQGMDVYYVVPDGETLKAAMKKYTEWLDEQVEKEAQHDRTVEKDKGL